MTEEMNGSTSTQPTITQMCENFIGVALTAVLNGIVHSLRQFPIDVIMVQVCSIFGMLVGQAISVGDLAPMLALRRRCMDAFEAAVKKVPVQQAPQGQPAPQAPVPRETRDLLKKLKLEN